MWLSVNHLLWQEKIKSVADSASPIWTQDTWPQEEEINARQANIQQKFFKSRTTLMTPKVKVCFSGSSNCEFKEKGSSIFKNRWGIRLARKCRGFYKL